MAILHEIEPKIFRSRTKHGIFKVTDVESNSTSFQIEFVYNVVYYSLSFPQKKWSVTTD